MAIIPPRCDVNLEDLASLLEAAALGDSPEMTKRRITVMTLYDVKEGLASSTFSHVCQGCAYYRSATSLLAFRNCLFSKYKGGYPCDPERRKDGKEVVFMKVRRWRND